MKGSARIRAEAEVEDMLVDILEDNLTNLSESMVYNDPLGAFRITVQAEYLGATKKRLVE